MLSIALPLFALAASPTIVQEDADAEGAAEVSIEDSGDDIDDAFEATRFKQRSVRLMGGATWIPKFEAAGPTIRLTAMDELWKGGFMVGGGGGLMYSMIKDNRPAGDQIIGILAGADFVIGGGQPDKYAVYGHLTQSFGWAIGDDGDSDLRLSIPWGHTAFGVGGHGIIKKKLMVGAMVDFRPISVGIDMYATLGFAFGKRS